MTDSLAIPAFAIAIADAYAAHIAAGGVASFAAAYTECPAYRAAVDALAAMLAA
jgi:hypothetical protein